MYVRDTSSVERDPHHTLVRETLRRIARRRGGCDERSCDALLVLVDTARLVRETLSVLLARHGLSETKFFALLFLSRLWPEATTAAELAYHTGVSRSATTGMIDQLEEAALVQRERSKVDRRTVRVRLSREGRALVEDAAAGLLGEADRLTGAVSRDRLSTAVKVCGEIGDRAKPALAGPA